MALSGRNWPVRFRTVNITQSSDFSLEAHGSFFAYRDRQYRPASIRIARDDSLSY
jgi:hypothetical protein